MSTLRNLIGMNVTVHIDKHFIATGFLVHNPPLHTVCSSTGYTGFWEDEVEEIRGSNIYLVYYREDT